MNFEEQLKLIKEEIEKAKRAVTSKTKEEKVAELRQKLVERFSQNKEGQEQDGSVKQFLISPEIISDLLDRETEVDNLCKYYDDRANSDYDLDLSEDEQYIDEARKKYEQKLNEIATVALVQTMSPDEITMELLEQLKPNSASKSSNKMFEQCMQKYVANIKPENVDESVLNFLYESNYQGEIQNPLIALAYKSYCDGKAKDEKIKELEEKNKKQEQLIDFDEKIMLDMGKKIKGLQQITTKAKSTLTKFEGLVHSIHSKTLRLSETLGKQESQSIFSIIAQRIKKTFSKTPMLPPPSTECRSISFEGEQASIDMSQSRLEIENEYNKVGGIDEKMIKQRQSMKKNIENASLTLSTPEKSGVIEMYFEKEDGWEIEH